MEQITQGEKYSNRSLVHKSEADDMGNHRNEDQQGLFSPWMRRQSDIRRPQEVTSKAAELDHCVGFSSDRAP